MSLLKKVIQGLINEDESSASEALHQYLTNKTRQIAGLNEENENDVGAQVKSIIKKLMPDDGMQLSNVQVDEDGIEFNVTADFKEHHPSMIGFQKNIKPLFSRIGFEKDDFEGRYYQLTAAKSFSDTEIADIEKALSALSESTIDDLKEAKEQSAQMNTKKPLKLKDFEIKDTVYHAVSSKKEGTVLRLVKGKGNAWGVPGVGRDAVIVDTGNGIKVFHPSELKLDGGK